MSKHDPIEIILKCLTSAFFAAISTFTVGTAFYGASTLWADSTDWIRPYWHNILVASIIVAPANILLVMTNRQELSIPAPKLAKLK